MNIILFTHPSFLGSQSMPRYAKWLQDGMICRGHKVEVWSPKAKCYNWRVPGKIKKWMGYIDQYLIFPRVVKRKLKDLPGNTLFVFADQALGPWVPLVANKPHLIHCHDFLAQRSATNDIPGITIGFTGRQYQAYIRKGYRKGKHFISISKNTQRDLHRFLSREPDTSEVVYNGLTRSFEPSESVDKARAELGSLASIDLLGGYLLHVGGNQWYKNRRGVIEIYNAWRKITSKKLPLIMIGAQPSAVLKHAWEASPFRRDIHLLTGCNDDFVRKAYSGASVLVFPSFEEGFGWPLIEAMASGCAVLTTDAAPMNEVGANAVIYIGRRPLQPEVAIEWAKDSAKILNDFLESDIADRNKIIIAGKRNIARFNSQAALDNIETIYKRILGEKEDL
ncbi:MAG: glycosyltransferase [Chitinophagaceae bacterium]